MLLSIICLYSCKSGNINRNSGQVRQGIYGKVQILVGEFDENNQLLSDGKVYTRALRIFAYPLTSTDEVNAIGDYIHHIHQDAIKETYCNENGQYLIQLEKGKYSLFIDDSHGLYAEIEPYQNQFYYTPIEVQADSLIEYNLFLRLKKELD